MSTESADTSGLRSALQLAPHSRVRVRQSANLQRAGGKSICGTVSSTWYSLCRNPLSKPPRKLRPKPSSPSPNKVTSPQPLSGTSRNWPSRRFSTGRRRSGNTDGSPPRPPPSPFTASLLSVQKSARMLAAEGKAVGRAGRSDLVSDSLAADDRRPAARQPSGTVQKVQTLRS